MVKDIIYIQFWKIVLVLNHARLQYLEKNVTVRKTKPMNQQKHFIQTNNTNQRAFTLIELMIVVMILAILTISIVPSFSGYLKNQNVKQAQENVKSDLRSIQNKALTGTASDQTVGSNNVRYWGVVFTNNSSSFTAFASTATDNSCNSNAATVLATSKATLPITGGATTGSSCAGGFTSCCVFFDMSNGDITESHFANITATGACNGKTGLTITSSGGGDKHICFNTGGLISGD
jgi:prepilin-type N-terminal cleavage/methylation domain-containing protein